MVFNTYHLVLLCYEVILYAFHISFVIFLFFEKSKKFNEAFYDIIRIIFVADIGFAAIDICNRFPLWGFWPQFYLSNQWLAAFSFFGTNYCAFTQFIAQTFLALNRFTALWIPMRHSKFWSKSWYTILILFCAGLPIAAQMPREGQYIYQVDGSVVTRLVGDYAMQMSFLITNGIFCSTTILGLIINILTVIKFYKLKLAHVVTENTKEAHLFYVTCILFIYQCFRCALNFSRYLFLSNKEVSFWLQIIVPVFADIHAGIGTLSLLFVSLSTRRAYLSFWRLHKGTHSGSTTMHLYNQHTTRNQVT